jgi:hypothetical protein
VTLDRIVLVPEKKMSMFQDGIQRNFCYSSDHSVNRANITPPRQMGQMYRFYRAPLKNCSCGGTVALAQSWQWGIDDVSLGSSDVLVHLSLVRLMLFGTILRCLFLSIF